MKGIEIPFGAKDSELCGWEYTIPEGMEAVVEGGKVIVRRKENGDERIRKMLISLVKHHADTLERQYEEDMLAYLEKQKEQPMSAEEVLIRAGLKPYRDGNQWCVLAGGDIQEGICGFGDTIDEALYQFLMEVLKIQKEQQPAEWNEDIIRKAVKEVGLTQHQIDWFKTNVFPPKQEWSKEDEYKLSFLTEMLEGLDQREFDTRYMKELSSWLKSLRSRPHWKPSEEQMEADLEKAAQHVYESWMGGTMDDVRRDMVELGRVINARKEG